QAQPRHLLSTGVPAGAPVARAGRHRSRGDATAAQLVTPRARALARVCADDAWLHGGDPACRADVEAAHALCLLEGRQRCPGTLTTPVATAWLASVTLVAGATALA